MRRFSNHITTPATPATRQAKQINKPVVQLGRLNRFIAHIHVARQIWKTVFRTFPHTTASIFHSGVHGTFNVVLVGSTL